MFMKICSYIRVLRHFKLEDWNDKCRVMRRYDLTAQMYDMRYTEEQEAKYKAALDCVTIKDLVLDVACGTGLLFGHVAAKAKTLVGVDISKQLLLKAKPRAQNHPNVNLIQADADYLPFRNNLFSVVLAFTLLQNMPQPLETLHEIQRAAKQGASVVVTGLKKAFMPELFRGLLEHSGLLVISFMDEDVLKCYIAVTSKSR